MQTRISPIVATATLILCCCLTAGCRRIPTQQGMLERDSNSAHISSHQMRVMVNEFVVYFADRIELRADQILAEASDPAIRKNALRWKINGISACFQAASRDDPLGAYLDVWILNRQMTQLFDSPEVSDQFGPWQSVARTECHALEKRLQFINQAIGGKLRIGEDFVTKFANDYPLTSLYFDREPIASRYIEEVEQPTREMFQVIANLDANVDELRKLSILFAGHLPKQARWEAELLLIDTIQQPFTQRPLQDLSQAAAAAAQIASLTEAIPQMVERERLALQGLVTSERRETIRELERMRRDTVLQLEGERAIVLDGVREERQAVLAALHDERIEISHEMNAELSRALQAADSITRQRAEELVQQTPAVIDHFFWRAGQLTLLLTAVASIVWFFWAQTRRQDTQAPTIIAMRERDSRDHDDARAA
jgi:hypothetical protein